MSYLYIVFTSVVSFIVLFLLCRLIGNRQLSDLSMFDYVNSITIGSIAAEGATGLDGDFLYCMIAIITFGILVFGISLLCSKSLKINRAVSGKSIPLISMDKIFFKNLKRARIDLPELLTQLRCMGYFDIKEVAYAYMETNGSISVLPRESARPATAKDVKVQNEQTRPSITLVSDGTFLYENIKAANTTKERILKEALANGCKNEGEILLATYDSSGNINIYKKTSETAQNDRFE